MAFRIQPKNRADALSAHSQSGRPDAGRDRGNPTQCMCILDGSVSNCNLVY